MRNRYFAVFTHLKGMEMVVVGEQLRFGSSTFRRSAPETGSTDWTHSIHKPRHGAVLSGELHMDTGGESGDWCYIVFGLHIKGRANRTGSHE